MFSSKQKIGHDLEGAVSCYLSQQGLKLVTANYVCKSGEIDLIFDDSNTLVFVEVRHRKSDDYGGAAISITRAKQRKVIRAATHYLLARDLWDKVPCRFDAVIVEEDSHEELKIDWIKDAFWVQ